MLHTILFFKRSINIILLCLLSMLFFNCSDDNDNYSMILLSVNNECIADVRLFDSSGKQIDRQDFDCQETKFLIFKVNSFGALIFHAETSKGKSVKKVVSVLAGKTIEESISF